jgi:acetoin utilization deacetylase AcuC-like enzyme
VKVGLSIDARFAAHAPPPVDASGAEADDPRALGARHPEHPGRLTAIEAELARRGLTARTVPIPARPATRAELERVHRPVYLDALEVTLHDRQRGWLDPDTYYAPGTHLAALLAAGAATDAALAVLDGKVDSAFALVRPPGHHATADRAMGFCLINNVAVAAAAARARGQRVAIFDWDVHHGNGTESIFYEDGDVLYASMHEWPQYPGTGARIDVGRGDGVGATINVPLPAGTSGAEYLGLFRGLVRPALERFAPDLMLVSAGFDAHREDPLGGLALDDDTYRALTLELLAVQPRLALVLEGGYHLPALARSAALVVETLVDAELPEGRRTTPSAPAAHP